MKNGANYNVMESALFVYPLTIQYCFLLFAVPIYQYIIVPFFTRFIPSMLKCMWFGLVTMLVESIMTTLASIEDVYLALIDNNTFQNKLQSDDLTLPPVSYWY